jgi:hypothetical protein
MLIKEIIERIQSLYSRGVPNDDSRLSDRHVYNKMLTVRMQLISQQIKRKQKLSDWNYVVLPCVELIKVPRTECSCLGNLGCDVYRTKYKLPKILSDFSRHYIEYVSSIDDSIKIEEVSRQSVLYLKGNKYTKEKPKYLLENGYLYFPIQNSPGIVKIKFLPEDPLEASKYPSICKEDCVDCVDCKPASENEFAIDGDLIEPLIGICVEEIIGIFTRRIHDNSNNSSEDVQKPDRR